MEGHGRKFRKKNMSECFINSAVHCSVLFALVCKQCGTVVALCSSSTGHRTFQHHLQPMSTRWLKNYTTACNKINKVVNKYCDKRYHLAWNDVVLDFLIETNQVREMFNGILLFLFDLVSATCKLVFFDLSPSYFFSFVPKSSWECFLYK